MKIFKMCKECEEEYNHIKDRRYHAQPNACGACGPRVWLYRDGFELSFPDPIKRATQLLKDGYIIAVKGIGGFHLACNAEDDKVIEKLRIRKRRERSKPFAIMSKDLGQVKKFCIMDSLEEALLSSPRRPIVLLEKKVPCPISEKVSPKNKYLGVMLPYTPLHHLLLDDEELLAVVMTSGNPSDEPLVKDNEEAIERLSGIADYILFHDRPIHNRCDDSVICFIAGKESMIRRSRGYVPFPVPLNFNLKQVLAVGGELKNTFCLTRGNLAFLSQHIGDLKNLETLQFFEEAIERFKKLFFIKPEIVAYDLHPDYLSTRFALRLAEIEQSLLTIGIQHHHAHVASCMAENGIEDWVIGIAMDGIGYGQDERIWGGEFFIAGYEDFRRFGHLKYIPMPGGDAAQREPYRMAISYLYSVFGNDLPKVLMDRWGRDKVQFILKMIQKNLNSPLTSSVGRLFDAVSSIVGIRDEIDYEAQAAMELEMALDWEERGSYDYEIFKEDGESFIVDPSLTIKGVVEDLQRGTDVSRISARFHNTIIDFILELVELAKERYGVKEVALSGGVFQNRFLLENTISKLKRKGFKPYFHCKVPTNDGGLSLGQAVVASKKVSLEK
jgi:hydrogenase maturation protein HypF